ncbi:MAG TPA: hypothetical protein PLB62_03885 [Candidatus Sumerlaeota bacterium]|nr:hypothetical protein [Candidatus Sumerlaeota bacterium]
MKTLARLTILFTLFALTVLAYAIPETFGISIQGSLTDTSGNPLGGERAYTIQFYDNETAGNKLGSLISGKVEVAKNGRFSILILPPDQVIKSDSVWYELGVDSADLPDGNVDAKDWFPDRVLVTHVPFAYRALDSGALGGHSTSYFASDSELAAALAGIQHNTLDMAYNEGGPGAGRQINAVNGPVEVKGANGILVAPKLGVSDGATSRIQFSVAPGLLFGTASSTMSMFSGSTERIKLHTNGPTPFIPSTPGTAEISMFNNSGNQTVSLQAEQDSLLVSDPGANLTLYDGTNSTLILDSKVAGFMTTTGGARISIANRDGDYTARISGEDSGDHGSMMEMYRGNGTKTLELKAAEAAGEGASVKLYRADGTGPSITLDGDRSGLGRVTTQELEITGGSDVSEQFEIAGEALPGMVVCIDPANPGRLIVSSSAYDRTVAGIVSGAGNVRTGLLMGQKDSLADGRHPVALTGRVYCLCDATAGAIQPGDLLTTSNTPGHAMKVTNNLAAQGAIIGKAMTGLEEGTGLVMVLVSLQ